MVWLGRPRFGGVLFFGENAGNPQTMLSLSCINQIVKKAHSLPLVTLPCLLLAAFLSFATLGCGKSAANHHSDSTVVNCTNLLVKNIALKDSVVELTIQNTCNNCPIPNGAYYQLLVIDRQTADTLNLFCPCYNPPLNGKIHTYILRTKPQHLTDPKRLRIEFGNLCKDLPYSP